MIDEEGTIPMHKFADGTSEPATSAIIALKELASNKENIVILVSGASKEKVHKFYAKKAP